MTDRPSSSVLKYATRSAPPSDAVVSETAWLYYVRGLTQGEVAQAQNISRPTVAAYLKAAKERGLIAIKLDPHHLRLNELSHALKTRFGVDAVHVLPANGLIGKELTQAVSEVGAHLLPGFFEPLDIVGVSWGETISLLAEVVPYWPQQNLKVIQLLGSMANPLIMSSERCTSEIARRLGGTGINMNAPAVCSTKSVADSLRSEPIIAEQLAQLKHCNKAVFSVSTCDAEAHVVQFKVATPEDVSYYQSQGAVCNAVGRFLDADGHQVKGPLDDRLFAVEWDDFRVMQGFMVVSGLEKAQATRAVLKGAKVSQLVLDDALAAAILALD
ncbi:sugar-binding domain-containing protein [uncultured Tateyamaria sp.]|uniref:sugar-binding transcriptional regulator n=1 Tax=uncultured Tateyamaria sp. TaxID=455651 RepID=UPI00260F1E64|nr:sugar-binding domain-containing protein [uncultured Tateyamaria sp.]